MAYVKQLKSQDHEIVLLGDFNDPPNDKSITYKLCAQHQLIDPWTLQFSTPPIFNTYARGKARIDRVLITPGLTGHVESVSYTDFKLIAESDHRGIIIDFHQDFLKNAIVPLHQPTPRSLRSNDRLQAQQYINKFYAHCSENNVFQLMEQLDQDDVLNAEGIETIDALYGQACQTAEKACTRRPQSWWSTRLHKLRTQHRKLNQQVRGLKSSHDLSSAINKQLHHRDINYKVPSTIPVCQQEKVRIRNELRELTIKSRQARDDELQYRYRIHTANGQKSKAKITREIQQKEQLSIAYRQVKHKRKKHQRSPIDSLDIPSTWWPIEYAEAHPESLSDPKTSPDWITITDKSLINRYMIVRNQHHFNQAKDTPFACSPWTDLLDWSASTDTAREIMLGTLQLSDDATPANYQSEIIKECQAHHDAPLVNAELTQSEVSGKLRQWRETTVTSPSGRHLGHYKVLVHRFDHVDDSLEQRNLRIKQQVIFQLFLDITNYAIRYGYTLQRWRNIESSMIPKDVDSRRIHRLRIIHIYEADYNLVLGIKWRSLLLQLEKHRSLHPDQHGSRPGHTATNLALTEELSNDIARVSRTKLVNFDNDASACYDRIIPLLIAIVNLTYGQHPDIIKFNCQALQLAKYKIRGDPNPTAGSYCHTPSVPIFGTGQGSANSPTLWCLMSSILFCVHDRLSHGASFCTPDQSEQVQYSIVGFVDDSTNRVNDFTARPQPSDCDMLSRMQHDGQLWSDLLWTGGGKLELPKCSYHYVTHGFTSDGTPHLTELPQLPVLTLQDPTRHKSIPISRKSVFAPHKTLGHYKSPSGTLVIQRQKRKDTAATTALSIVSSSLRPSLAYQMYLAVYIPTVQFTLPQGHHRSQDLETDQSRSMRQIFSKCGFNCNIHRAILYAPRRTGGAGFVQWYTLQGEGQLLHFVRLWRSDTKLSTLLRIELAWAQLQCGVSFPILAYPRRSIPTIDTKWLVSLRAFLATIQGQLRTSSTFIYPLQRQHDCHLMDVALERNMSLSDIDAINRCRLYLQVCTLSDLCTVDGLCLHHNAFSDTSHHLPSSPKWLFPIQDKPHSRVWDIWDAFLFSFTSANYVLRQPLEKWLYPAPLLARTWHQIYDPDVNTFYQFHQPGEWVMYTYNNHEYSPGSVANWTPMPDSYPCAITPNGDPTPLAPVIPMSPPQFHDHDFNITLAARSEKHQHFMPFIHLFELPEVIMYHISSSRTSLTRLHVVSDGAATKVAMSYGWVIAAPDGTRLAQGSGPGYGHPTSYRAEAYGFLAANTFLQLLFHHFQPSPPDDLQYTACCDNKGLLTSLAQRPTYDPMFPNYALAPDWDLIEEIHQLLTDLPLVAKFTHVQGHQDSSLAFNDLTLLAQLNVEADQLAGEFLHATPLPSHLAPLFSHTKVHLDINGVTKSSNLRSAIRFAASVPEFQSYTRHRHEWDVSTAGNVHWDLLYRFLPHQPVNPIWSAKYQNNILNAAAQGHAHWSAHHPKCPHCSDRSDHWEHQLLCPYPTRRETTQRFLEGLIQHLWHLNTDPLLVAQIKYGLATWLTSLDPYPLTRRPELIHPRQQNIGWYAFLRGYWSKDWVFSQQQFLEFTQTHSRTHNGMSWAVSVLTHIWSNMHRLWVAANEDDHPDPLSPAHRCTLEQRILDIQTLHQQTIPHDDFSYQFQPHDFRLASSVKLQNWLSLYASVIPAKCHLYTQTLTGQHRSLSSYFVSEKKKKKKKIIHASLPSLPLHNSS